MAANAASPRHLALRNARKAAAPEQDSNAPAPLAPGEQQLFSFYKPSLAAGEYTINVSQDVQSPAQPPNRSHGQINAQALKPQPSTSQSFRVSAPQFALPDNAVQSSYPPDGYGAPVETLPHLVLNDPHLPWERVGSSKVTQDITDQRNSVPWLALLVFSQNELVLSDQELGDMFGQSASVEKPTKQTATFQVAIQASELRKAPGVVFPVANHNDPETEDAMLNAIFLEPALFNELVRTYGADGKPVGTQKQADITRYKYLAHVRNINTMGMPNVGTEEVGLFSVVLSHRTGPLNLTAPTPVSVHLVSLEDIENMPAYPVPEGQRVALPSLYSWSYNCLPPDAPNLRSKLRHLGDGLNMLRVPNRVLDTLAKAGDAYKKKVAARMSDGYTLTRYRLQSGEVSAALLRGAFTPANIPHPLSERFQSLSLAGSDLEILDPSVGLMDITYAAAWQLGKTLAIADQGFCASLSRIRSLVHQRAMNLAKANLLGKGHINLEDAVKSATSVIDKLKAISAPPAGVLVNNPKHNMLDRWRRPERKPLDLSLSNPSLKKEFSDEAGTVVEHFAGSADSEGDELYNELNKPNSTDWMTVLTWVLDRMYLANIPAHYLIPDPSYLPAESMRMFYIDANWVDALIDGALSIGHHLEDPDDSIRSWIKRSINKYLSTEIPGAGYLPQIPIYGFLMRSDIVSQFPDLKVQAPFTHKSPSPEEDPKSKLPATILRHANIADGVKLCLFDRYPGTRDFVDLHSLAFTQPPHQQSFVVGPHLDGSSLETSYKRIFSTFSENNVYQNLCDDVTWQKNPPQDPAHPPPAPIFKWSGSDNEVRTLILETYSADVLRKLTDHMPAGKFTDDTATAAMVAVQLNNAVYKMDVTTDPDGKPPEKKPVMSLMMLEPKEHDPASVMTLVASSPVDDEEDPEKTFMLPPLPDRPTPNSAPVQVVAAPHYKSMQTASTEEDDRVRTLMMTVPLVTATPSTTTASTKGSMKASRVPRGPAMTPFEQALTKRDPANKPIFKYRVYPISTLEESALGIPTNSPIKQDLVFSIVLTNPKPGRFHLSEIKVVVPRGRPSTGSTVKRLNLLNEYAGPGPTMLSNLRLNVLAEHSRDAITLRVIPRSTTGYIPIDTVREASFVLGLVEVNPYQGRRESSLIWREKYVEFENEFTGDFPIVLYEQETGTESEPESGTESS
ncbi:Nn.00g061270.m01.CDS01 [Neocucurbitaria sp. VM-36]